MVVFIPNQTRLNRKGRVIFLLALGLAFLLSTWLTADRSQASPVAQPSPLETPAATPAEIPADTPTPFEVPAQTPELVPADTATSTPTLPAAETLPDGGGTTAAETPALAETPQPLLVLPPVDRPTDLLLSTPAPDPLNFVGQVVAGMANVAAWLWLTCGSLIFFVVTGIVGGLYFSQRERNRYELYTLVPEERVPGENPQVQGFGIEEEQDTEDEDIWPASLP